MKNTCRLIATLLVAVVIGSCSHGGSTAADPAPGPAQAPTVTVKVYSGKPNPHWTLTPEEAKKIVGAIDVLDPIGKSVPKSGGLGFTGYTIAGLTIERGQAATIEVSADQVGVTFAAGKTEVLADTGGVLNLLTGMAADHLKADDLAAITAG